MGFERFEDEKYVKWAKAVKIRDDYVCKICGRREVELHSHHIRSWDVYLNERYDIQNGITLCHRCHSKFHSIYGKGNNNEIQFSEFFCNMQMLISIIKKGNQTSGNS